MSVLADSQVPSSVYLRLAQSQPNSRSATAICYEAAAARCLAELAQSSECASVPSLAAYAEDAPDLREYLEFLFEEKAGYYHLLKGSSDAPIILFQLHIGLLHVFTAVGDRGSQIYTAAFHRQRAYELWREIHGEAAFPAALLSAAAP